MSCNHCATKFNFFHKEVGCSNCGLAFCNKCVKHKSKIPSKGPGEYNVCRTCFAKLSAGSSSNSSTQQQYIQPPDAYLKRLEALENPVAPPITIYKNDNLSQLRSGLSAADQQLIDRLEKLKDDGKGPPPSESELRRRLANLKSENNYVEGPSKNIFVRDTRSDHEKTDSLLEQFITERDIELAHNPQDEIEARLASLREQGVRPNEGPFIKNLHDSPSSSEDEVERITKKIMDEVALDNRCPITMKEASDVEMQENSSSPELPWCVLCNEDAIYRCFDCGGDLYCSRCNVEAHKTWGDYDHHVVPYKRK